MDPSRLTENSCIGSEKSKIQDDLQQRKFGAFRHLPVQYRLRSIKFQHGDVADEWCVLIRAVCSLMNTFDDNL